MQLKVVLLQDLVEEWQTPQLMIDGMTRDDIKQGILGDCWFLSSCAAVSQREKYMKKVPLLRMIFRSHWCRPLDLWWARVVP